MEEDIKILEEMIKANDFILSSGDGTHPIDVELTKRNQALKHLIHRNIEFSKIINTQDYIPKSKVKEKIEELDKEYNEILKDYGNIDTDVIFNIPNENVKKRLDKIVDKIIVLKELLEEEQKWKKKINIQNLKENFS